VTATSAPSVEDALVRIWQRALGRPQVGLHDDFFGLGGESLSAAEVVVDIHKTFGRQFPLSVLHEAPTIASLAKRIREDTAPQCWPSLAELQPQGNNPPFFFVHGAGGTVLGFTDLARHFAPDQPFYGIRAQSPQDPKFRRVEEMAAQYLDDIRSVQATGPYYLGGYSFGGSVALELAQQLVARGERVGLLAIVDHTPPPTRYRRLVWTPTMALDFVVNAGRWLGEDIWRAGSGRRLAAVKRQCAALKAMVWNTVRGSGSGNGKADVKEIFGGRELPESFQRLLEIHYQAMREYVPRPYPGRVTLFRARVRPLFRLHGRDLGWKKLARGGLDIVTIPGNHESLLKPPHVQVFADRLLSQLRKAQADSGASRNGRHMSLALQRI
jgi:thioesterase domain-containing protein/acyl carrier protein